MSLFPDCPHADYIITLCDSGPHYAKKLCRTCERFLGWVANPKTAERRADILAKANELYKEAKSLWECQFLNSVIENDGKMSPKQEAMLNGMWARRAIAAELKK